MRSSLLFFLFFAFLFNLNLVAELSFIPIRDEWKKLDGQNISLSNELLKNKKQSVVVIFRAEDCPPCIKSLSDEYMKRGFNVFGIVGYLANEQLEFIKTWHPSFPILLDYKYKFIRNNQIRNTPIVYIIKDGNHLSPIN